MARTGVGYLDIAEAASQLEGRGQSITVDSIRLLLGTGSRTTIANHLKTWKSQQTNSDISGIPQELAAMVKGLWERLQSIADVRVTEIEQVSKEKIGQIQHILEQERRDSNTLRAKIKEIETHNHDLKKIKEILKADQESLKHSKVKLETQLDKLNEQLEGQKQDNSHLHKMNSRIQDHLEFTQKELIKLKKESDLTVEKQRLGFTAENQQLSQILQDKIHRNHQLELELKHNNAAITELKDQVKSLLDSNSEAKATLRESQMTLRHLQLQYDAKCQEVLTMQHELKEQTKIKHEFEKSNAVMNDHLRRLEKRLELTEDSLKRHSAENINLQHEKETLLIQIKHLQNKVLVES